MRGHEFHNSQLVNLGETLHYGFGTERGKGIVPGFDGLIYRNTLAGYHHLHVSAAPGWAAPDGAAGLEVSGKPKQKQVIEIFYCLKI